MWRTDLSVDEVERMREEQNCSGNGGDGMCVCRGGGGGGGGGGGEVANTILPPGTSC